MAPDALLPYVPAVAVRWMEQAPELTARTVDGTGVFADISGFTALTEQLARKGAVGAEEMGEILNDVFAQLLAAAYEYGAELVKWGGDAVFLLFQDAGHVPRAARAALAMQDVMRRIGRVRTSSGSVRLAMSIGLHAGDLDFMLVGELFRELIITGPGASMVARMESAAAGGEIVVSAATVERLARADASFGDERGGGRLLLGMPGVEPAPLLPRPSTAIDLRRLMPEPLAAHLGVGHVEYEHRNVGVCFVEFSGVDEIRLDAGLHAAAAGVERVVSACQAAAAANEITFLSTDIYPGGGKVILVAGAPTSSGDDAARILTAARQVLDSPQLLPLRVGVNVGRVFAGDYGPANRRVYSLTGDCVNLAARLMAKAERGELVASSATLERSRTRYRTTVLEPFTVKGKTEPISAALVHEAVIEESAARAATPLTGRARELELLREAWESASLRRGRAIELVGDAGLGKSRLVDELVASTGAATLRLTGDIYGTGTPYQPFQRLFAEVAGIGADDHAGRAAGLRALVTERAPHLLSMMPLLGFVAGVELEPTAEVTALDPDVRKQRLEETVSEALGAALDQPLLLVADDAHFMDQASTDLIDRLVADVADRPWLVVVTRRPESQWTLTAGHDTTTLELGPLSTVASLALLHESLGERVVANHRLAKLVERAGGNPLFLTELVSALDALGEDMLPDTVEGVIAARIDRLPAPARTVLRNAAVLGMSVDPTLLAGMLERSSDRSVGGDPLSGIQELLVPTESGDFRFSHHLVRETAYEGLPFRRRVALHGLAADLVAERYAGRTDADDLLSLHSLRGQRFADAYRYSCRAGAAARDRFANAESAECYQRALAAAKHLRDVPAAELGGVWEELGWLYEGIGDLDAMDSCLTHARTLLRGDALAQGRLSVRTAIHRRLTGRYADALRWLSRGRSALVGRDDQPALQIKARLAERYADVTFHQGRFRETRLWAERAMAEAVLARDADIEARAAALRWIATDYVGERVDLAAATSSLHVLATASNPGSVARCHSVLGVIALNQGNWRLAIDHYQAASEAYGEIGLRLDVALMNANAAEILISQGQLDRAEDELNEAMSIWRGTRALGEQGFGLSQLGRIALARENHAKALELFESARALHLEAGERFDALVIGRMIAECLRRAGEPAHALEIVEEMLARRNDLGLAMRDVKRVEGEVRLDLGETLAGSACLRESVQLARQADTPYEMALGLLGLATHGVATVAEQAELEVLRAELAGDLGVVLPAV